MNIVRSFADIKNLEQGKVYALPTDTVYGLSCAYNDTDAVHAIRRLKERDAQKPVIVLIATLRDLELLGIRPRENHLALLKRIWPGPVSVVFQQSHDVTSHLASNQTLAVRMPERDDLRAFITRVGPIVSTSANPAGKNPATSLETIESYFSEGIDTIVDTGFCNGDPSTVLQILR